MNKQKKFTKKKAEELCLKLFGIKKGITQYATNGYEFLLGELYVTMCLDPFSNCGEGDICVSIILDSITGSTYYDYETLEYDYKANEQYKNEVKREIITDAIQFAGNAGREKLIQEINEWME